MKKGELFIEQSASSWVKNAQNKADMNKASKLYKSEINRGFSEYSFQAEREFRNTS